MITTSTGKTRVTNTSTFTYRFFMHNRKRISLSPGGFCDIDNSELDETKGLNKHFLRMAELKKVTLTPVEPKGKAVAEKKPKKADKSSKS